MVPVCFLDNDHGVAFGRCGTLLIESRRNWPVSFIRRRMIIITFRLSEIGKDRIIVCVCVSVRMIKPATLSIIEESLAFVTLTCCWRAPRGVFVPSDVASCWPPLLPPPPPPRALNLKLNKIPPRKGKEKKNHRR